MLVGVVDTDDSRFRTLSRARRITSIKRLEPSSVASPPLGMRKGVSLPLNDPAALGALLLPAGRGARYEMGVPAALLFAGGGLGGLECG